MSSTSSVTPSSKTVITLVIVFVGCVVVAAGIVIGVAIACKPSSCSKRASSTKIELPAILPAIPRSLPNQLLQVPPARQTPAPSDEFKRTVLSVSPSVEFIHAFLTDKESDDVVALAEGRFNPSEVVDDSTGIQMQNHPARTSNSMYLEKSENALIKSIEERAARLTGLPSTYLEVLQVVKYAHGQFYKPHFDYLPVNNDVIKNGQRTATIFVYLNTLPEMEKGGGTHFPELQLTIKPEKGSAGFWHNIFEGKVDPRVLHGGETIQEEGTVKYGMNIWFRDRPQYVN